MLPLWNPTKLDLVISAGIAVLFPILAQFLYVHVGALLPMALYYLLAWGLAKWRRGSTGYSFRQPIKGPPSFWVNCGVIGISLVFAFLSRIEFESPVIGILATALLWATVNAASEQLLWIYIFDSWDLPPRDEPRPPKKQWVYRIIGLLLFSAFVGTIHTLFWTHFLHTVEPGSIFGLFFILFTTVSGFIHILVWRQSNNMLFTFIPHFMLNLIPLFWTGYSIVPYLW